MKKTFILFLLLSLISCNNQHQGNSSSEKIITVSIAPFRYFVDAIAAGDFSVNVMVPPGSDPHIYEPVPGQIAKLRASEGYISNGYLGFEMTWLDRLYEVNPSMKRLNLGESIEPIESEHHHEGDNIEGADPHYWVSPMSALKMAESVKEFLQELNPTASGKYEKNYTELTLKINELDKRCRDYFSQYKGKSFMIYHPNLAYLARDYGLNEIAVESDGKEPSPAQMKNLIDISEKENITTIFVQREYDTRNAKSIAAETGAEIVIIDPLSEDWYTSTSAIIDSLYASLKGKR
ncbi:MAG TPA: zinc ABC transporter substrate-binding protein [Bacteroidales bacterium]|nr:zinc ABC transporter substrate-binding protein [Bacteroidales bacterium]